MTSFVTPPGIRLAFVGTKGAGKSLAANYLTQTYGFVPLSFATTIKYSLVGAINTFLSEQGIDRRFQMRDFNAHKQELRPLMQWFGTDLVREWAAMPNHWLRRLENDLDGYDLGLRRELAIAAYVVDDVRFLNEASMLRSKGFTLIRLTGHAPYGIDRHASETELLRIPIDDVIENMGSAEDLFAELDEIVHAAALALNASQMDCPLAEALTTGIPGLKRAAYEYGGLHGLPYGLPDGPS